MPKGNKVQYSDFFGQRSRIFGSHHRHPRSPMRTQSPSPTLGPRQAGVLLHLSSLPGPGESGSLGPDAERFLDFLEAAGLKVWQMLPVGPTQSGRSPYQTSSVHAGDPFLIALEPLIEQGWLARLPSSQDRDAKTAALREAWLGFQHRAGREQREALQAFTQENRYWLEDYRLFRVLREEQGTPWWEWPSPLRHRDPEALAAARSRLSEASAFVAFEQFLFFHQWSALRRQANARGIRLFGDMPIFVAPDSAEVWARPQDFWLRPDGTPQVVAGVPPDYFSETGQRWGNPLYRWEQMQADGFRFWLDRVQTQLQLFDLIRIDHFRGFEAYWEIPAEEPFAQKGRWVKALGDELFERLQQRFGKLPFVAEDLGVITPEVEALRQKYRFPGMKVLQFAFSGEGDNPYLPFHHGRNAVVYTGTHDNDTTLGWYHSLVAWQQEYVMEYLGHPQEPMPWPLIRTAFASRAQLAIVPMQDFLALDSEHRMNVPGTSQGNWRWRFHWDQVKPELEKRLQRMAALYGRL